MGKGTGVVERKENGLVDVVKFICAIVVAAGHCYLADVAGFAWFTELVKLAVQIFFLFSGYYLVAAGTLTQENEMVSYVRHLFTMTMIWAVLYFILNLLITDRSSEVWVYDFITLWTEFFSSFNCGHLWYLQNMLIVAVLLFGMKKTSFSRKEILVLLLISTLFFGRITRAVFGIAAGMYLAGEDGRKEKNAKRMLLIGMGTAAAAGLILWQAGDNAAAAGIMTNYLIHVLSILIAYGALHGNCGGRINYVYIRKQSTLIYLMHLAFVPIAAKVLGRLWTNASGAEEKGLAWCLSLTVIVTVGSILCGSLVLTLAKRERFEWLKRLY